MKNDLHTGIQTIFGVDFSGAKLAGENIWIAESLWRVDGGLQLSALNRLATLAGSADREVALSYLCTLVKDSSRALWAIDFPFGLPVEIGEPDGSWQDQLRHVNEWKEGAPQFGRWCLEQALKVGPSMHIRRTTDTLTKTPFDCYHYRIIYQTFHGMRDVLLPLSTVPRTAILPFQYDRLAQAERIVIEACPGSTLKRLSLPHQNYKQPGGGALTPVRRRTRRVIVDAISKHIEIAPKFLRTIMRNPGGDALDAVIAAVGAHHAWLNTDHNSVWQHARFPREGFVYA